ncbi:MAG: uracil-DNA glycosylase family protein [Salegentibacter sp.]
MKTFADKVIAFNKQLKFKGALPEGIKVLNPFRENPEILKVSSAFYKKFYSDQEKRKLILGINPGRLGAGATGIPFTDTKRLSEICGLHIDNFHTHEPSSVFIYDLIDRFGGAASFYNEFYINSVSPLGFVQKNKRDNWVNCNYYDHKSLLIALKDFIISSLKKQLDFGIDTSICFVLGKKNAKYLEEINKKETFFDSVVALDHPRYIVQYKSKEMNKYLDEYSDVLSQKLPGA